jgi:hypothetical protein
MLGVARSKCRCGTQVLWKADEPASDEWVLAAKADLPDHLADLPARATDCAFCPECGRLWVAWDPVGTPAEYVPANPGTRPLRRRPGKR